MTDDRKKCRGYIGSRNYQGSRVPQHVQNLVIRDFCTRNDIVYLLSATEYAMQDCYMMLEQVVGECSKSQGLVAYSLFMLPEDLQRRQSIYRRVLETGSEFHAAVESLSLRTPDDVRRIEEIWRVHQMLPFCIQTL